MQSFLATCLDAHTRSHMCWTHWTVDLSMLTKSCFTYQHVCSQFVDIVLTTTLILSNACGFRIVFTFAPSILHESTMYAKRAAVGRRKHTTRVRNKRCGRRSAQTEPHTLQIGILLMAHSSQVYAALLDGHCRRQCRAAFLHSAPEREHMYECTQFKRGSVM